MHPAWFVDTVPKRLLALMLLALVGGQLAAVAACRLAHVLVDGRDLALLLDCGVRLVVLVAAAWLGSRWLARASRRLAGEQSRARELLVASISHDLRAPLTRLRMRMETEVDGDRLRLRSIADIHEMDALIANVMEMGRLGVRPEVGDMGVIDVDALLRSVVDDLAAQGQRAAVTGEAATGDAAMAHASPQSLRRVLTNLVGNAVRHGGGARARLRADARRVVITVEDDGPGIPADELATVLQPFYRSRAARLRGPGGTGLGLYIAAELVRRQGGELVLENRAEGGLRAVVSLRRP